MDEERFFSSPGQGSSYKLGVIHFQCFVIVQPAENPLKSSNIDFSNLILKDLICGFTKCLLEIKIMLVG